MHRKLDSTTRTSHSKATLRRSHCVIRIVTATNAIASQKVPRTTFCRTVWAIVSAHGGIKSASSRHLIMQRRQKKLVMILSNTFFCAIALFKIAAADARLADVPAEPEITPPPMDDVQSCLLDTEGCGLFRRPVLKTVLYRGRYVVRVYEDPAVAEE